MKPLRRIFFVFLIGVFMPISAFTQEFFKIDIHGYISQGYLISNRNNFLADTEKGTFHFNELGINFSTELTDKIRLGIQFAARDLGDTGNDRVLIDWAYADYQWQDWLGIRVGKMKLPVGFYNKTRDIDMLRTFVLLPQGIYLENFREAANSLKGIGVYGEVSLNLLGDISYQVLIGTTEIDKDGSTAKSAREYGPVKIEKFDVDHLYSGSFIWEPPLKGLRLGATLVDTNIRAYARLTEDIIIPVEFPPYFLTVASRGDAATAEFPKTTVYTYSVEYTWKNLVLAAEYQLMDQDMMINMSGLEPLEFKLNSESYYGSASYRFTDWFELGVYYMEFYKDRNDKEGTGFNPPYSAYQKDACACLRFDLNAHWTFKLEGHLVDGVALCLNQDNLNAAGAVEYDKKWAMFAVKMTFNF
ncbi:MAG: hypothetical protein JSV88_02780 [Candidatus Aminicenantes bacterium]|nr:MAG: hypothetical protein JSV88_02780 [Candidatus Aminicenantes bacterium]